jgi:hypothetical protein
VSNPLSDLSASLTLPIRTPKKKRNSHHEPVEQLSEDKMPRQQRIYCSFETLKGANTGSRDPMDVDGMFLDEIPAEHVLI